MIGSHTLTCAYIRLDLVNNLVDNNVVDTLLAE